MKDKHGFAALMLLLWLLPAVSIISCQSGARDHHEQKNTPSSKAQKVAAVNALSTKTPDNYMIAFIGDQGPGENGQAVLRLIKNEGAAAVIHAGDFDYDHDPAAWDARINAVLGPDFPYFACVGNHDKKKFYGAGGYQEFMEARMSRLGIIWEGDLGGEILVCLQWHILYSHRPRCIRLRPCGIHSRPACRRQFGLAHQQLAQEYAAHAGRREIRRNRMGSL